jgi:glyoxylate utilization-related uncharacterized protein
MQEKVNLEKTEHENAQWFWNLLHKKLAELRCDMEESVVALEWGGVHGFSCYERHYLLPA